MKLAISLTTGCIAILCTSIASAALTGPTSRLDVNGDGRVDGRDADQLATMLASAGLTGRLPAPPSSPFDVNRDGALSFADWQAFVALNTLYGNAEVMFDVVSTAGAPMVVGSPDRLAIAQAVSQGPSYYRMRFDLNADGLLDIRDWVTFTRFYRVAMPEMLADFDGNGSLNGQDLDLLARVVDTRSFDQSMDLDGDGRVTKQDYQAAVAIFASTKPKALFDVDGRSGAAEPVVSGDDAKQIATGIAGLNIGFPVSIRYDLDGDGQVAQADWAAFVRYATMVYRKPDLVLDVNGDGVVNNMDLQMVSGAIGTFPVQPQYDVNADGRIDARDVALLETRLAYGPLNLLAGDVNRDGCVTAADLALVQAAFGASSGQPLFDPDLDASPNGYIGSDDVQQVTLSRGRCQ